MQYPSPVPNEMGREGKKPFPPPPSPPWGISHRERRKMPADCVIGWEMSISFFGGGGGEIEVGGFGVGVSRSSHGFRGSASGPPPPLLLL